MTKKIKSFNEACTELQGELMALQNREVSPEISVVINTLIQGLDVGKGDELKSAVRVYNAIELCYADIEDIAPLGCEIVGTVDWLASLSERIIRSSNSNELAARWFACPRCGKEVRLYTYDDIEDTRYARSNARDRECNSNAVYEFMHISHLCHKCWLSALPPED